MTNKDLEVIIYVGCPASGKTTEAKKFIKENSNYVRVSRDDFRYMLKNEGVCNNKIENMITDLLNYSIIKSLSNNLNVIVDNTNLKVSSINSIVNNVTKYANVSFKIFDVPYDILIERDSKREKSVGKDVIDNMYKNFKTLITIFDFKPIKKIFQK